MDRAGVAQLLGPLPLHVDVGSPDQLACPDIASAPGMLYVCHHARMRVLQVALIGVEDVCASQVVLGLHVEDDCINGGLGVGVLRIKQDPDLGLQATCCFAEWSDVNHDALRMT